MGDSTQTHDFAKYKKVYIGKNPSLDTISCLAILRATVEGFKSLPVTYTDKDKITFADDELMIGGSALPLNEYPLEGKQLPVLVNCLEMLGLSTDRKYDQLVRYKKAPRLNSPFDIVHIIRHGFHYRSIEETLLFLDFAWNAYIAHQEGFMSQDCNRAIIHEYSSRLYRREIASVTSNDPETVGALRHRGKTFVAVYNPDSHVVIIQGKRNTTGKALNPGVVETLQRAANDFMSDTDDTNFMVYQWTFNESKPQIRGDLKGEATVGDVEEFLLRIAQRLQMIDIEILYNLDDQAADPSIKPAKRSRVRDGRVGFEFGEDGEDDSSSPALSPDLSNLLSSLKFPKKERPSKEPTSVEVSEPDPDMEKFLADAQAAINSST